MKEQILIGLVVIFAVLFTVIGVITVYHVLRSQKYPADKLNRINKIRLWWFALTKEEKFVGFFPWLRRGEWDNVVSTAPVGDAKDMFTVIKLILENYRAQFSHNFNDGKIETVAALQNVTVTIRTDARLIDETPTQYDQQSDPNYVPPTIYHERDFELYPVHIPKCFETIEPTKERFKTFAEEFLYLFQHKAVEFRIQNTDHGVNVLFETKDNSDTMLANHITGHAYDFMSAWLSAMRKSSSEHREGDAEMIAIVSEGLGHRRFILMTEMFPKHSGDSEGTRVRFEFSAILRELNPGPVLQ